MFSLEEQINRKKNKTNHKKKRKRNGPKYSNYIPKSTFFSNASSTKDLKSSFQILIIKRKEFL